MQIVPERMVSDAPPPPQKVWQVWPGSHTFCCDGHVMVGPDGGVTLFAFALVTGASVCFWVFVCPSLHAAFLLGGIVIYTSTVGFMAATATTDPGILPSNRSLSDAEADACAAAQRFTEVNGVRVPLKWCRTCRIYRPPRAAHCSECNVCVEKFDHHCPWMGQCIGRRNYRYFLGFVHSVVLLCAYTLALSGHVASLKFRQQGRAPFDLAKTASLSPVACGLIAFTGLVALCVAPLACYHCSLVCNNTTTSEEIKETYRDHNPFSGTVCYNCNEACCEAREAPKLAPRALASEPERLDTCQLISNEGGPPGYCERAYEDDGRPSAFENAAATEALALDLEGTAHAMAMDTVESEPLPPSLRDAQELGPLRTAPGGDLPLPEV